MLKFRCRKRIQITKKMCKKKLAKNITCELEQINFLFLTFSDCESIPTVKTELFKNIFHFLGEKKHNFLNKYQQNEKEETLTTFFYTFHGNLFEISKVYS